jgi:hypothetical protein
MIDVKKIEERVNAIEQVAQDVERLVLAKSAQKPAEKDTVKGLAAMHGLKSAARRLASNIRSGSGGPIPISARDIFGASVFRHSILGSTRATTSKFNYYQTTQTDIRGGRRIVDVFPMRFVGTNNELKVLYPTPSGSAGDVAEGAPKPTRTQTLNTENYQFTKLAVTDTLTTELILADTSDNVASFIMDALVEHVLDVLTDRIVSYIASNATAFNPATYAGYLNIPANTARWHDLVTAMQLDFTQNFADYFIDFKWGNLLLAGAPAYYGILQDRKAAGLELYYDNNPLGNLSLDSIWRINGVGLYLTHTEALAIEMVNDVQLYYDRVVDGNEDRNLYRATVELYYRFVPTKLPLPAIGSAGLSDLQML